MTLYRDEATETLLASQMGEKGRTTILPQIIAQPQGGVVETAVTGSDNQILSDFIDRFDELLTDEIVLIEKRRDGFEIVFDLTSLHWTENAYDVVGRSVATQPPKSGIWFEAPTRPTTASENDRLPMAIFGLPTGQVVCRAGSTVLAGALLSFLRQNPQVRQWGTVGSVTASDDHPGIHLRLNVDLAGYDRVFTKIGINLCAFVLGLDVVRNPAFDGAIDYARNGVGTAPKTHALLDQVFGPPLPNVHVMMLLPADGQNGSYAIAFMSQLYGGPVERFRLAEFAQPIAGLTTPVIIHIDYQNNHIERLTLEEHVGRVAALHGDWTTSTVATSDSAD